MCFHNGMKNRGKNQREKTKKKRTKIVNTKCWALKIIQETKYEGNTSYEYMDGFFPTIVILKKNPWRQTYMDLSTVRKERDAFFVRQLKAWWWSRPQQGWLLKKKNVLHAWNNYSPMWFLCARSFIVQILVPTFLWTMKMSGVKH